MRLASILLVICLIPTAFAQSPEEQIRAWTKKFTEAIVSKDLSVLDEIFEKDPDNIFYDINEGPLRGFDRLKSVWTAATINNSITRFVRHWTVCRRSDRPVTYFRSCLSLSIRQESRYTNGNKISASTTDQTVDLSRGRRVGPGRRTGPHEAVLNLSRWAPWPRSGSGGRRRAAGAYL